MLQSIMKVIITSSQPSRFEQGLVYKARAKELPITKQNIIIGRGEVTQQDEQHAHVLAIGHKSISRKHANISVPYTLVDSNARILTKTMLARASTLVPKYYFKFGGLWEQLPQDLLVRVREYCMPRRSIVIRDLGSRFGLYQLTKSIRIADSNVIVKHNRPTDQQYPYHMCVTEKQSIVVQLSSLNMQVRDIARRLTQSEMTKHHEKLCQSYKNVKKVTNIRAPLPDKSSQVYWSLLIQQLPLCQEQTAQCYLITVKRSQGDQSQKISLGRNSSCHIKINKTEASRKQAYIYVDAFGRWVIEDANSTNGTWLKRDKVIYDIDHLKSPQQQASQSSFQLCSNTNILQKLKNITVKLGEIRLDIQIQGAHEAYQNILKTVSKSQETNISDDYTKILAQISNLNQSSENSKEQKSLTDEFSNDVLTGVDLNQSFYGDIYPDRIENSTPNIAQCNLHKNICFLDQLYK